MVDYENSSQLHKWMFPSPQELRLCRAQANYKAREVIFKMKQQKHQSKNDTEQNTAKHNNSTTNCAIVTADHFAAEWNSRSPRTDPTTTDTTTTSTTTTPQGHPFLTPDEETILVNFYANKLPNLIGPNALRIRREAKVTATAALFLRRFFLSNSVMLFDPKIVMVAAAFLASKVEDATADIRQLEEGTALMNAPVSSSDIIPTEVALLEGLHFELRCFHPYKAVVALTEDLRTFLKTKAGQALLVRPTEDVGGDESPSHDTKMISGQDLIPIYDRARAIVDRAIVSDIPLLYAPGQVGLAALMLAAQHQQSAAWQMDLLGYLKVRFPDPNVPAMEPVLQHLCHMLGELEKQSEEELQTLKNIHKKLKKVRVWGHPSSSSSSSSKKEGSESKKKRKREESSSL